MSARGQRTEDGRQTVVCRCAARFRRLRGKAAAKTLFSVLRPPSSVLRPLSSDRGFTLLELIIVITIIVTMMGLFMNRALFYMEQAEKTAMEGVEGSIQSSLTMQYGQILTRGKPSDVPALAQDNPINWLQKKPRNYAGEFYDPTPLSVESGNWMFDLKSRELVYVVRNANYFSPGKDGKKWIRFHVAVSHEPSRLPSLQNAPPGLTGIQFEPVEPYSWFEGPKPDAARPADGFTFEPGLPIRKIGSEKAVRGDVEP